MKITKRYTWNDVEYPAISTKEELLSTSVKGIILRYPEHATNFYYFTNASAIIHLLYNDKAGYRKSSRELYKRLLKKGISVYWDNVLSTPYMNRVDITDETITQVTEAVNSYVLETLGYKVYVVVYGSELHNIWNKHMGD